MNASALWLTFRLGARKSWAEPAYAAGGIVIFLALVLSYGEVLKALPVDQLARLHLTRAQMVWYLIVTEAATVGMGFQYKEIQDDIRSGAMDILLLRPIAFWPMKLADWSGQQCVRIGMLMPACLAAGIVLTGSMIRGSSLMLLVPSYAAAMLLMFCSFLIVGCTSLWIGESRPVFMIYQKLIFVLGGLLWPLAFYPPWLSHIAWLTPFSAITAVPGDLALDMALQDRARELGLQAAWTLILLALCPVVANAVRRRITQTGGRS